MTLLEVASRFVD